MKPQILVYQMPEEKVAAIRNMLSPMGIRVRNVTEEEISQTLENLMTEECFEPKPCSGGTHEVLVMCGFSQVHFSLVMGLFQRKELPTVPVKAMMTEINKSWSFQKLVTEIWEEHRQMHKNNSKKL